ncbi:MAG TPA: agmatine deiminase family protein [Ensifer sp.]|uniref:agmatine deiminase family protein n=1 Tax=Ensifer sp. TaxID=1872086 RepID=UPI002E11D851|nr:agmatine deiminase family protein [Ensifer sp.]
MITRRQAMGLGAMAGLGWFAKSAAAGETAGSAGYYYPEESAPHERTFMQWPVSSAVYDDTRVLAETQRCIARIANAISEFEPVVMLMDQRHQSNARKLLGQSVEIWNIPTEDLWCRDSGPSFVVNGKGGLAITQFNFNGWGGKQVHRNDGKIAARVAEHLGLRQFDNGLVGEAGGVETDGRGTLIAHESSWINRNRNKGSRQEIEAMLLEAMGADKIIWAPGIKGADITDYHIDALARFTGPGVVLIQMGEEVDPDDPWSAAAFETHDRLAAATDADGKRLKLVVLPDPLDVRVKSADFVSSYVNYYVCNGGVIAAQFGDHAADAEAAAALAELYPGREIVTLDIDALGRLGGGIHCATHEQPKV